MSCLVQEQWIQYYPCLNIILLFDTGGITPRTLGTSTFNPADCKLLVASFALFCSLCTSGGGIGGGAAPGLAVLEAEAEFSLHSLRSTTELLRLQSAQQPGVPTEQTGTGAGTKQTKS